MSVCPKCKREYAPGRKVCPADGTRLPAEADEALDPGQANTMQGGLAVVETDPVALDAGPTLPPGDAPPPVTRPRVRSRDGLDAGDMVDEYRITGKIGEGGMGKVFSGIQPVIGKKVAIKLLQAAAAANPEVVARFVQEARAVNQIHSRYIVDIFSFGNLDDGQPYFVMEHLDGVPLRQYIKQRGALRFDEAHALLTGITKGLGAAHEAGIFHRDLKPENIIVVEEDGVPTAKILDFGIAKLTGSASNPDFNTATGMALGTPYYMSPEQARGVDVDHRTDIYSLGVIMFEMFTGVLPFAAKSYIDLVNLHLYQPPPKPREVSDEVPAELEAVILGCLEKEKDKRPQSMQEVRTVLDALAPALSGASFATAAARPDVASPAPGSAPPVGLRLPATPVDASVTPRAGGRRGLQVGLIAAALLVAGGAGYYFLVGANKTVDPSFDPRRSDVAPLAEVVKLTVSTRPAGAAVLIDGARRPGKTPLTVQVEPGNHELRLELGGHRPLVERIELEPGTAQTISYVLAPPGAEAADAAPTAAGRLEISAGHPGATYHVDGRLVGSGARLALDGVAAGDHALTVRAPGRRPERRRLVLAAGQTLRLALRLKRAGRSRRPRKTGGKKTTQGTTNDPDRTLDPFKK